MSEDSSSDEDLSVSTERQSCDAVCWECGKRFSSIYDLMVHYKSHNIKATCHICSIIFRHLVSLSTHLHNAHSPPLCRKCHLSFSNVWELNKHAEMHCLSSAPIKETQSLISTVICQNQNGEETAQQSANSVLCDSLSTLRSKKSIDMKTGRVGMSEISVEYTLGEDDMDFVMDSDCEQASDSTSTDSDDEGETCSKPPDSRPDDPESDDGSSSTDCSSDTSNDSDSKKPPGPTAVNNESMCSLCGNGPFRSMKLHLRHCSRVRVKYQCSLCKKAFRQEKTLKEHYMPLYSCNICGQVFSQENIYLRHQCPKESKTKLVLFCPESMPKVCTICKSFFTCEKTLLYHVTKVHTSVVSTKVCIITNPSALADKNASPDGRVAQSATSSPNVVGQVFNGKLNISQTSAESTSTGVKSNCADTSTSSNPDSPSSPACVASTAHSKLGNSESASLSPSDLSTPSFDPSRAAITPRTAAASKPAPPTILAMFENDSQDVALMKRMNTGWRLKAPYSCRQCGAVFRQPSLIISHRYLHRGPRSHRCPCGRAFKHRLHLLRHCVQHAEAKSYICVSCGDTFKGARLLAEHMRGKPRKNSHPESRWKHKVKSKCAVPFTCDCGHLFFRPSAYIWHQIKNWKTKQVNNPAR